MTGTFYNFGAGPAMLPRAVMERAREEFLDWHGCGMSVMEMSHRGPEFLSIAGRSEQLLRQLLHIPDDYAVLFLQGGAASQFAMIPLNLVAADGSADYVQTGLWSKKAIDEARRHCRVNVVNDAGEGVMAELPDPRSWRRDPQAAYLYYTANETVGGIEFHSPPDAGAVPLASDMTSNLLSRPVDVRRYAVICAGAQKNFGPSGLVVVIVRRDLLGRARAGIPSLHDYALHEAEHSMANTPPTFAWYVAGLAFEWISEQGGVEVMERNAIRRSAMLYAVIDEGDFYANPVAPAARSRMNVPFTLADPGLDPVFLRESEAAGLLQLKGHRSVGGMRASLYNGMPDEGVIALVDFMRDFARRHG